MFPQHRLAETEAEAKVLEDALSKIEEARRRRNILLGLSTEPVRLLLDMLEAQAQEMRQLNDASGKPQTQLMDMPAILEAGRWFEEAALRLLRPDLQKLQG